MSGVTIDTEVIHDLIKKEYTIERISQLTGHTIAYLTRNYGCFYEKSIVRALGHKDCAYFDSEEEMLNSPVYTYESLSDSEKQIYDEMAGND
jgi:hypothetical protein